MPPPRIELKRKQSGLPSHSLPPVVLFLQPRDADQREDRESTSSISSPNIHGYHGQVQLIECIEHPGQGSLIREAPFEVLVVA